MDQSCTIVRTACIKSRKKGYTEQERQDAARFARRISRDLTNPRAALLLDCSTRVVAALRGGNYHPGDNLINRWRLKFGDHLDRALTGSDPVTCAKRARVAMIVADEL